MIDVLPRYPEAQLRMRVNNVAPGKEVILLKPQGISSTRSLPSTRRHSFIEGDLNLVKYNSPSEALIELVYDKVRTWLNEDPLLWCQYGAKFKLDRLNANFYLLLYPFSRP